MEPRDDVVLRPHDESWARMFEEERRQLGSALGPVAISIEHIGSTSVPGLSAKPVIDILVTTDRTDLDRLKTELARLGYVHVPIDEEGRLFFRKGTPRTHHVHVVAHGGPEHRHHLAFRDWLRGHPDDVKEYERVKMELARRFPEDRAAYCEGKAEVIGGILAKALGASSDERD